MKRIIILLSILPALLFATKPYNERADNFNAKVTSWVTNITNILEFHYSILYDSANPRNLSSIDFLFPSPLSRDNLVEVYGYSDKNVYWSGSLIKGLNQSGISFFPMGEKGKPMHPETVINLTPNLRLYTRDTALKAGERLDVIFSSVVYKIGG